MYLKKLNVLLLTVLMGVAWQASAQDVTSNLQAWYKFDYETGDTYVADYSGNNRHLAPVKWGQQQPFDQNFTWGTATINGATQNTVYFPVGRDADIQLSNATGNNWLGIGGSQARTFCAWVKIDAGADDFAGRTLFAYGDDSQPGGRFEVALKGHSLEFENAANNGGNNWVNRSVAYFNDTDHPQGQWMHIALVFNGTGNRKNGLTLYVNGKKLALTPVNETADMSINTVTQYAPEIGLYMVKMAIADMRFYGRALTAADVHVLCPDANPVDQFSIAHMADLIQTAANNNDAQVVIPPGTYTGTTSGNNFIALVNVNNLEVIANGVTMMCGKKTRAIQFYNCKDVVVRGLTIDYNPLTFTQGDIVATGTGYVDVKIHKGYDVQPYSRIDIIDPATRYRKRGSIFVWDGTAQVIADSVVRVSQPALPGVAVVGDMATMSVGGVDGIDHAIAMDKCRGGMQLINVTIHAAPGFGILEAEGEGGTHLDSCHIIPGPLPANATQTRLLSSSWDAIQHKLTRVGPTVENCTVKDAGDDSWSVTWDEEYTIGTVSGNIITATPNTLQVGDSIRTSLTSDVAVITAKNGNNITLNKVSPWQAGTRFYSPNRRCENFVLRNNYFNSTGRVLVKAGNGIIENNSFINTHSGVAVNTEIAPGASSINKLIIRNNIITGTGHFMPGSWTNQAGAISIADGGNNTFSQAGVFDDILIEKNTLDDISGVNVVITSASNVTLKENVFHNTAITTPNNTGSEYGINQNTVLFLRNLNHITLDSNEVINHGLDKLLDTTNLQNFVKLRRGIFVRGAGLVPMSVYVTSPSNNASFNRAAPIVIEGTISGPQITKAEFYAGTLKIGETTTAPYTITWNNAPVGTHIITVKAYSDDNRTAVSENLTISVKADDIAEKTPLNPRNLFTPNGDGKNDFWEIEHIQQWPDCVVTVYNRRGNVVYTAKSFTNWDGMQNGAPAAAGVYFYSITENNKVLKSGTITLIR